MGERNGGNLAGPLWEGFSDWETGAKKVGLDGVKILKWKCVNFIF